jgi:hypothetical protein
MGMEMVEWWLRKGSLTDKNEPDEDDDADLHEK